MSYEFLSLDFKETIAVITLRRPETLNALNRKLTREFHEVLNHLASNTEIRVIVLTGEGRGFCSGADVSEWPEANNGLHKAHESDEDELGVVDLARRLRELPQPLIAAVNGIAAGAGLALALASDIRIAAEEARFSAIFVKRSLVPDTASSYTLPMLVGHGIASEMTLTGNIYDASWGLKVGLINKVVPQNQLLDTALDLAKDIAGNPPITVRSIKRILSVWYQDLSMVTEQEKLANIPSSKSSDRTEAVRAFIEKRTPSFKGE